MMGRKKRSCRVRESARRGGAPVRRSGRTVCAWLVVTAALTSCDSTVVREAHAPGADSPAPTITRTFHARAGATARNAATPKRAGLDAPVVWHTPSQRPAGSGSEIPYLVTLDQLLLIEVRADAGWLHIDVVHEAATPSAEHTVTAPTVTLRANGCHAAPPALSGSVWLDSPTPSTLTIPLSSLPDGEIDLTLKAFDVELPVPLKKSGTTITWLQNNQRAGYRMSPGDPARGILPSVTLGPIRTCP